MSEEKKQEEKKQEEKKTEEKEKEEVKVPEKFKKIVEEIEKMSVLDLAELVKILEDKFGVSPIVSMASAPAGSPGQGASGAGEEEKSTFDLELSEAGDNRIEVIKILREITQKGLKECKDIVDNVPQVIKSGIKKEEAEELKKKLESAGAKVTLK